MCWPAAHRERRASSVSEKRDGEVGALSERTEENPSVPGGAAGAHSAHKAWAGPLAPAPALVLRALRARKAPPPPGAHPTAPCYPTPTAPLAVLRRLPGGAGRLGRTPGGRRAAKQKSRALGLWPRALLSACRETRLCVRHTPGLGHVAAKGGEYRESQGSPGTATWPIF